MILVDYSGIAMAVLFTEMNREKITKGLVKHMILNSLRMYNLKYRDKYGEMVIAIDSSSWRKSEYPEYKAGRSTARESQTDIDWDEFFNIIGELRVDIQTNFPWRVVKVEGAEADDIIGVLTAGESKNEPVMIISADHDFVQLQKYSNVKQFSPHTKKLIQEKNPEFSLFEKIIRGDKGDGVPNILSHDRSIVDGERQRPITAKFVNSLYSDPTLLEKYKSNYDRNRKMIDLSYTPERIKVEILNQYNIQKPKNNVLSYLIKNRMTNLIECASEFNTNKIKHDNSSDSIESFFN